LPPRAAAKPAAAAASNRAAAPSPPSFLLLFPLFSFSTTQKSEDPNHANQERKEQTQQNHKNKMSRKVLLALLLAGVLLAAPMVARADDAADEEYDDEEDGGDGAASGEPSEKDVVVIGDKNWSSVVGASKYALVSFERNRPLCRQRATVRPPERAGWTPKPLIPPGVPFRGQSGAVSGARGAPEVVIVMVWCPLLSLLHLSNRRPPFHPQTAHRRSSSTPRGAATAR
jgi:hypothetical protein